MSNNNTASGGGMTIGVGIPSVVIGVLIALKKVGMTTMSYGGIIWFGVEVFLVCAFIGLAIWMLIMFVFGMFGAFNKH
jgi:hypothetical protein